MDALSLVRVLLLSSVLQSDGARHRRPLFSGTVPENRPAGTKVSGLSVQLTRLSREPWCSEVVGRQWHLRLLGVGESHFQLYLQHRYGQVTVRTAQQLDREVRGKYMLRLGLCCKLCLTPQHTVTELALLTIHVLDLNDNAPQFSPNKLPTISLEVTTKLKSEVYKVSAEDADQGTNADLVYFADPINNYFFVIPKTGQVVLVESILNLKKSVNLTIFARDHGQPPLVSAPFQVEISPTMKKFGAGDKEEVIRLKRSLFTLSSLEENTNGSFQEPSTQGNQMGSIVALDSSAIPITGAPLEVQEIKKPIKDTPVAFLRTKNLPIAIIEDMQRPKASTFTLDPTSSQENPTDDGFYTSIIDMKPSTRKTSAMDESECLVLSLCSSAVPIPEDSTVGSPLKVGIPSRMDNLVLSSFITHKDTTDGSFTAGSLSRSKTPSGEDEDIKRPKVPSPSSHSKVLSVPEGATIGNNQRVNELAVPDSSTIHKATTDGSFTVESLSRSKTPLAEDEDMKRPKVPSPSSYSNVLSVHVGSTFTNNQRVNDLALPGPSTTHKDTSDGTVGSPLKVGISSKMENLDVLGFSTTNKDITDGSFIVGSSSRSKTPPSEPKETKRPKVPSLTTHFSVLSVPEVTTIDSYVKLEFYPRVGELAEKQETNWEQNRLKRSPVSPDSFSAVSIPEDTPVGSIITTLVSKDLHSAWYELVSPSPEDSPVAVNRDNGDVLLISTLDRESQDSYECLIKEQQREGKGYIGESHRTQSFCTNCIIKHIKFYDLSRIRRSL